MEGPDFAGFIAGNQAVRGIAQVDRLGDAEGADYPIAANGGKWVGTSHGVSRSTTPRGIYLNGARI